jgi:hypothetical protein
VRPFAEFGDDQAFFAGDARTADAAGMLELPLPEPQAGQRPPCFWATTPTHAGLLRIDADAGAPIRVPQRGRIVGRAWLDGGKPAAGRVIVASPGKGLALRVRAAADGTFTCDGVPAAHGVVVMLMDQAQAATPRARNVELAPGATVEVALGDPVAGATLRGRVQSAGQGVAVFFGVRAVQARDQRGVAAGADGVFQLEGVAPGQWHAAVYLGDPRVSDDFTIASTRPLELQSGQLCDFTFDLPAGILRVRVVDAASGSPLPGARVTAQPEGDSALADRFPGFRFRPGWAATTDARGEVLLRCLPEGETHRLEVRAAGHATGRQQGLLPSVVGPEVVVQLQAKQ